MPSDTRDAVDWVDRRVKLAREIAPVGEKTTQAVASMMRERLAERQLPVGEITRLAKDLVDTLKGEPSDNADR